MKKKKRTNSKKSIQKSIWVVVPAYNESNYIERVLVKLKKITNNVVVIDDGSDDATADIAKKHFNNVLRHKFNLGKGAALKTGCEFAFFHMQADAVIFIDSDDQHDPNEITLFEQAFEKNAVVFGVRTFDERMPFLRKLGNIGISYGIQFLFGTWIPDVPSGFKGFSKDVYRAVCWEATDYGVELEIAIKVAKNKIPFSVVPIKTIYHDMDRGMNLIDVMKIIINMILLRISL